MNRLIPPAVECAYAAEAKDCARSPKGGHIGVGHDFKTTCCRRCSDNEEALCADCGLCKRCIEQLASVDPLEWDKYRAAMAERDRLKQEACGNA